MSAVFLLSFSKQNSFTYLNFLPELPQFKLREADSKCQDFLQSHKLLQTLGQEAAADHPVLPVFPP